MFIIYQLLSLVNLFYVFIAIFTSDANAACVTGFSFRKAFAVQLQAIDFGAFTSCLQTLAGGQVQIFDCL
jgi:hypothetical protein